MKLCECGCGLPTTVSLTKDYRYSYEVGQARRFCKGHSNRKLQRYRVDEPTGCWLWLMSTNGDGYGVEKIDGRSSYAHINSYVKVKGPIPEGAEIDHLCRTPACINPDHLEAVTRLENIKRSQHFTKLVRADVDLIRSEYEKSRVTQRDLATRFGVSQSSITNIVNWKVWL